MAPAPGQSPIDIQRLLRKDLDLARALVIHFYGAEPDDEHLAVWLDQPAHYLLAACLNDELAGFLLAFRLDKPGLGPGVLYVAEIDVIPAFRRQGIGRALIDAARALAADEHLSAVELLTNHSNAAAVAFYRQTGGEVMTGDDLLIRYDPT